MTFVPEVRPYSVFLIGNGNLRNCKDLEYHCASAHLGKSEASAHLTLCLGLNLPPLDKAGVLNQQGAENRLTQQNNSPHRLTRDPTKQLGSHTVKNEESGGCFHGEEDSLK